MSRDTELRESGLKALDSSTEITGDDYLKQYMPSFSYTDKASQEVGPMVLQDKTNPLDYRDWQIEEDFKRSEEKEQLDNLLKSETQSDVHSLGFKIEHEDQLAAQENIKETAKILGVNQEEASKLLNIVGNKDYQGFKDIVEKANANPIQSPKKPSYHYSSDVLLSYYSGPESLQKLAKGEHKELWDQESFMQKNNPQKDYDLKYSIIQDISNNYQQAELKEWWEKNKEVLRNPSKYNEAILDNVYDKWFIHNEDTIFNKAPWWEHLIPKRWEGHMPSIESRRQEAQEFDTTIDIIDKYAGTADPSELKKAERLHAKVDKFEYTFLAKNYRTTKEEVSKHIQSQSDNQIDLNKIKFNNLSEQDRQAVISKFKEHSRRVSPQFFKEFENTERLPFTDEDYANIISQYDSNLSVGGSEYADRQLQEYYQNTARENSTWGQQACGWLVPAGINFATFLMDMGSWGAGLGSIVQGGDYSYGRDAYKEYLYNVQKYQTFSPEEIERRQEEGLGAANRYVSSTEQDDSYFSWKTGADLLGQVGTIAGFAAVGSTYSKLYGMAAKGVVGLGAKTMGITANNLRQHLTFVKNAQKFKNFSQWMVIPTTVHTEASLEAIGVQQEFINSANSDIKQKYDAKFIEDLTHAITADPDKFATIYQHLTGIPTGKLVKDGEFGTMKRQYSDSELNKMLEYFSSNPDIKENYLTANKASIDAEKMKAINAAEKGAAMTYCADMVIGMILNGTLNKSLFPVSVQRVLSKKNNITDDVIDLVFKDNKWNAIAKEYTKNQAAKNYISRATGEFLEEYLQSLGTTLGEVAAEDILQQYQSAAYANNTTNSAFDYDLAQALSSGLYAVSEEIFSKEAIQSGLYGALSSLIGLPGIKRNNTPLRRGQGESWTQYVKRQNPFYWDSIFSLPFSNTVVNEEQKRRDEIASFIQSYLDDSEKQNLFMHAGKSSSALQRLHMATTLGDEKAIKDAEHDVLFSAVSFLSSMRNTEYYKSVMEVLNSRANLDPEKVTEENSEESKAVSEYYSLGKEHQKVDAKEAVNQIKKSAKDMLDLIERAEKESIDIKRIFGEDVDIEFLNDVVKNRLTAVNKKERLTNIDKELEEYKKTLTPSPTRSKWSESSKKILAQFGDSYKSINGKRVYAVEEYLAQARARINAEIQMIKDAPEASKRDKRKAIKEKLAALEAMDRDVATFVKESQALSKDEKLLGIEEILELPDAYRGTFLTNSKLSKEQRNLFNKIPARAKKNMVDGSRLSLDYNKAVQADAAIMASPAHFGQYHQRVHAEALQARLNSKYAYLNNPEYDYDTFRDEFFKAHNSMESSHEANLLLQTIKSSPHYNRFSEEQKAYFEFLQETEGTSYIQNLRKSKDSKDTNKWANIRAIFSALYQKGEFLDVADSTDKILEKVTSLTDQEIEEALTRQGSFVGEYQQLSREDVAAMLTTVLTELRNNRTVTAQRTASPENVSTQQADNTPSSPEIDQDIEEDTQESSEEAPETKPTSSIINRLKTLFSQKVGDKEYAQHGPESRRKTILQILDKIYQEYPEGTSEDIRKALDFEISGIKDQKIKRDILRILDSISSEIFGVNRAVENRQQEVIIEGHTGARGNYMSKHASYETLATTDATNGTEVLFMTPAELLEEGQPIPVVALIPNEKGKITVGDKKYSPVGFVEPTTSMIEEYESNPNKKGDYIYTKSQATITSIEKEGFGQKYHERNTPVKKALGETGISVDTAARKLRLEQRTSKKGTPYSALVYDIPRGAGKTTIPVELYITPTDAATNSDGQTMYDVISEARQSIQEYKEESEKGFTSTEEKDKKLREVEDKVSKVEEFNGKIFGVITKIMSAFNGKNGVISLLKNNNKADSKEVKKALQQALYGITDAFSFLNSNTKEVSISVDNVNTIDDTLSFDINLNLPNGTIKLATIDGLGNRKFLSKLDAIEILANLALKDGKMRTRRDGSPFLVFNVQYTKTDKEGNKEVNIGQVKHAINDGIISTNHTSFKYPVVEMTISYKHVERAPVDYTESTPVNTDNAAAEKTPTDTITTVEGVKVNPDTGQSAQPNSSPIEEDLASEQAKEEVAEAVIEQTLSEAREQEPAVPYTDDLDYYDDEEYQLVTSRETKLTRVKEFFKNLLTDSEAQGLYETWTQESKEEFNNDTERGAFLKTDNETLKDTKERAERRATEIRKLNRENIKSVSVVKDGNLGYRINITYHSYPRFLARKLNTLSSLTNEALSHIEATMSNKKEVLNPSQKEAEKQVSIFQKFKHKALHLKQKEGLHSSVNEKLDKALKNILKKYGISVIEKDLEQVHGQDVAGKLNSVGQIIYLAKNGARNKLTLSEETAHTLVNTLERQAKSDPEKQEVYSELLDQIEKSPIYNKTLDQYSNVYIDPLTGETDLHRIKKEAIGKALAVVLADKYDKKSSLMGRIASIIEDIITSIRAKIEMKGLTKSDEFALLHNLNNLANATLKEEIKKETSNKLKDIFNFSSLLSSLGLNITKTHTKSALEVSKDTGIKELAVTSSAVTFKYEYLDSATQKALEKKGITKQSWENSPLSLQEALLTCLNK